MAQTMVRGFAGRSLLSRARGLWRAEVAVAGQSGMLGCRLPLG